MWVHLTCPSLLLWNTALRVEIADVAALRPRCRIDRAIDQGRLPRSQRLGEGLREPLRIDGIVTDAAKGFDQLVVARVSSPWPGGSILITRAEIGQDRRSEWAVRYVCQAGDDRLS